MSGACPSIYFDTASSAAFCAFGSIVVVTCSPWVFSVCSSILNSSSSSLVTCRSINPLGPVVWFCARAFSGATVGGNSWAARSFGDSAPISTMPSSTQFHRSFAPGRIDRRVKSRRALDQRGQQCAVGDRELIDGFVEVGLDAAEMP